MIELPEIVNIPEKMLPVLTDFNKYRYFVIEGGRGSGKTQSIARILTYLADVRNCRIVCGREIQKNIEESVYTVLADLIRDYSLDFTVKKESIENNTTGSRFRFKGFREQGAVSIKGLEGVDVLWVDEAQAITKNTLDVIIPTIRKEKSKMIFTLNRLTRDDAVINQLVHRDDCLHIRINYDENPFCPMSLKVEAQECLARSERDYNHIWLGHPMATTGDYLFNFDKLEQSKHITPFGALFQHQRVMGIDFAAQGDDFCVATVLDRISGQHWECVDVIRWDEPDTTVSTGKIVALIGEYKPNASVLDIGGMGKPVYDRLKELRVDISPFNGATTDNVDTMMHANLRAYAYDHLSNFINEGNLILPKEFKDTHAELEKIKFKYRSNGSKLIQSKLDMKKEMGFSPDHADSIKMAAYATTLLGGKATRNAQPQEIKRVDGSHRHKRR